MRHLRLSCISLVVLLVALPLAAQLRVQPVGEHPGDVSLRLMLRKLATTGTFMHTTAHPDDEDNTLLAMLGFGEGMRTVLVTATRGDGGQNEIGPELFQGLAVLRTEELLAAHRFDGAEQYFTRAIDFGFSFSMEETLEKWGHDEILADFVRHIRITRPDVIAGFICGGPGGGQHHQASAQLTQEAFHAAADPLVFPEQLAEGLRAWQAGRVFCTDASGFGPRASQAPKTPDQLIIAPIPFEPLIGRTYAELGTEARSMHKCQGMSQLLPLPGMSTGRTYRLQETVIGQPGVAPATLFDGIDTTLGGLAAFAGPHPPGNLVARLEKIADYVSAAGGAAASDGQSGAAPPLAAGLTAVRDLRAHLGALDLDDNARYEIDFRLDQKERQFEQALMLAYGLRVEVLADDGLVTAGQPVRVSVNGSHSGPPDLVLQRVTWTGFDSPPSSCSTTGKPSNLLACTVDLRVGQLPVSTPYWTPRADAARYDFEPGIPFGVPFRPSPFRASLHLSLAGVDVTLDKPVEYRYDDIFAGEKRMEPKVVPPLAVTAGPDIAVIPAMVLATQAASAPQRETDASRVIEVTVANNRKGAAAASVSLAVPPGWMASPEAAPVTFAREDEASTARFTVTPPPGAPAGDYTVRAVVDGFSEGYEVIEYPHIHRRHVARVAETRVKILDVSIVPDLQVGYVAGVGDQVPQAIEQLGAAVHLIGPAELASGDLSRYDAIVTGVRAYERRPDLRANNQRLLAYAERGGIVLVQYNKFEFNEAQYGPFPAKVSADRVTDETAPVEVLVPDHPVFTTPNRIGPDAWAGWVQERGLYFLGDRDPRYVALVRVADPFPYNPGSKTGALVEARVGKGRWIYIGLGLWRQLPAGTAGAYRLLANLLSLDRTP